MLPNDERVGEINDRNDQQIGDDGVAKPERRRNCGFEPGDRRFGNEPPCEKLLQRGKNARFAHPRCQDEERKRDEQADVSREIEQEGSSHASGEQLSVDRRE